MTKHNGHIQTKDHRCYCRYNPLLGKYGIDDSGVFYHVKYREEVDIKVYKSYIKTRCSVCKRYHTIRFVPAHSQKGILHQEIRQEKVLVI
jgi:hypothetical protein